MRSGNVLVLTAALTALAAGPTQANEPALTVSKAKLAAAFHCHGAIDGATTTPIMLVTGTGATGEEAYALGKPALDAFGHPVCDVDFPDFMTADIQLSVQYLVYGIREEVRRAGRRIAVVGISQGGLLPRIALTYWPSLRNKVGDVVAMAGTQHGTIGPVGADRRCSRRGCAPAVWQQAAGSNLIRALDAQPDETPGPTSWTTVRSATDETVRPTTGRHPASALAGATNILIQDVCPGRKVSHIGTALDSVTHAAIQDAIEHPGPAKLARLPGGVCSHRFGPGFDEQQTAAVDDAAGDLVTDRIDNKVPRVHSEPRLRPWFRRRVGG
jgi:hypothetical protein